MHYGLRILAATAALALAAAPAHAAVTISSAATQNMSCSGGICAPTAKSAILNVGDLESLLASGNATVTTTGTGVQANDIHIRTALGWANSSTVSLEANRSIAINAAVSITGLGGLVLDTGKNLLSFGKKGNVTFANLSSQLMINGSAYTLVGDIKTLAIDIGANSGGNFALANNYNASGDGTYTLPPIITVFTGTVEGLGNAISNFSIAGATYSYINREWLEGLFAEVGTNGLVENIGLVNANVVCSRNSRRRLALAASLAALNFGTVHASYATGAVQALRDSNLGGLVGGNEGTISNSHAGVTVSGKHEYAGGIVGINGGTVSGSYATGAVSGRFVGGLVDVNFGIVSESYATGDVRVLGVLNNPSAGGGLVEYVDFYATVNNSYATGAVSGGDGSAVGGLVGTNANTISFSYSTGAVTGGAGSTIGGLIGDDAAPAGSLDDTYWDTDTSGITNLSQGAGNIANDPGITGLTTAQFQSGLPTGFDPAVWAESSNINGGLPYLIDNPPPK